MIETDRTLAVYADGMPVAGFRHARLTGRDALGLYPMPFTLRLWNLPDSDVHLLSGAKEVSVKHGHAVLASGTVSDVCPERDPEGRAIRVVFAAGLSLWEAPVSLSVEAGVSVSETVRRILAASGTGIRLLSFPGADPVRSRGQAFFGRAAECIGEALSAAGARGCLVPSGLCIIPASGLPASMALAEEDLTEAPVFVDGKRMLLKTKATGWPLGKAVSVAWKGKSAHGLLAERSADADNMEGSWNSELLLELQDY